jgi:hypothetical protein
LRRCGGDRGADGLGRGSRLFLSEGGDEPRSALSSASSTCTLVSRISTRRRRARTCSTITSSASSTRRSTLLSRLSMTPSSAPWDGASAALHPVPGSAPRRTTAASIIFMAPSQPLARAFGHGSKVQYQDRPCSAAQSPPARVSVPVATLPSAPGSAARPGASTGRWREGAVGPRPLPQGHPLLCRRACGDPGGGKGSVSDSRARSSSANSGNGRRPSRRQRSTSSAASRARSE